MNRKHTLKLVFFFSFQDSLLTDFLSTLETRNFFLAYMTTTWNHALVTNLAFFSFEHVCILSYLYCLVKSLVSFLFKMAWWNLQLRQILFRIHPVRECFFCGGPTFWTSQMKGGTSLLTKALKEFNKPIKRFKRCCLSKQTYRRPMRLSDFSHIACRLKTTLVEFVANIFEFNSETLECEQNCP